MEFKTLQRTIGKIGRKKFTSAFVAVGNGKGLVGKKNILKINLLNQIFLLRLR